MERVGGWIYWTVGGTNREDGTGVPVCTVVIGEQSVKTS